MNLRRPNWSARTRISATASAMQSCMITDRSLLWTVASTQDGVDGDVKVALREVQRLPGRVVGGPLARTKPHSHPPDGPFGDRGHVNVFVLGLGLLRRSLMFRLQPSWRVTFASSSGARSGSVQRPLPRVRFRRRRAAPQQRLFLPRGSVGPPVGPGSRGPVGGGVRLAGGYPACCGRGGLPRQADR